MGPFQLRRKMPPPECPTRLMASCRGPHGALELPIEGKEKAMERATVQVRRQGLLDALSKVNKVIDRKAAQPILANVLVETTSPDRVTFTATDFEVAIEASIEAQSRGQVRLTVNAKRLTDLLKKLPKDADLVITHDKDTEWLTLTAGQIEYRLATMPAEEYPSLPTIKGQPFKVTPELFEAMGNVLNCASTDETRYILNGVHLAFEGEGVEVVATDGHQLAQYEYRNGDNPTKIVKVTVHRKAVHTALSIFKGRSVWMVVGEHHILFWSNGLSLIARSPEGHFPDYKQIIPKQVNGRFVTDRKGLIEAIEGVAIMASDRSRHTIFEPKNGSVVVSAEDTEVGSAKASVNAETNGETVKFAANAGYVLNALKTISTEDVVVNIEDALSPIVMKPSDSEDKLTMVIMPMRM